jgi:hypothetical protein
VSDINEAVAADLGRMIADGHRIREAARAVIAAWDNAAPTQPCDECLRSGVDLWTFEDDNRMDTAIEALRVVLGD